MAQALAMVPAPSNGPSATPKIKNGNCSRLENGLREQFTLPSVIEAGGNFLRGRTSRYERAKKHSRPERSADLRTKSKDPGESPAILVGQERGARLRKIRACFLSDGILRSAEGNRRAMQTRPRKTTIDCSAMDTTSKKRCVGELYECVSLRYFRNPRMGCGVVSPPA